MLFYMYKSDYTWSKAETFKLIKKWEQRPCLWQKQHVHFMSKRVKAAAIAEISTIMGIPEDIVYKKLRSLRTIFFQNYRKLGKKGCANAKKIKWSFFNAVKFIAEETTDGVSVNVESSTVSKGAFTRRQ